MAGLRSVGTYTCCRSMLAAPSIGILTSPYRYPLPDTQVFEAAVAGDGGDGAPGGGVAREAAGGGDIRAAREPGEDALPRGEQAHRLGRLRVPDGEGAVAERGVPLRRDGGVPRALQQMARVRGGLARD